MENLWKYLKDTQLNFNLEEIPSYLICGICNDLVKEAVISTCGCRFCQTCIDKFLNGIEKLCPNCKRSDILETINACTDLKIDASSNEEVENLTVKCPHSSCNEVYKICHLLKHATKCEFNASKYNIFHLNKDENPLLFSKQLITNLNDNLKQTNLRVIRLEEEQIDIYKEIQSFKDIFERRDNERHLKYSKLTKDIGIVKNKIKTLKNRTKEQSNETKLKMGEQLHGLNVSHEWRITNLDELRDDGFYEEDTAAVLMNYRVGYKLSYCSRPNDGYMHVYLTMQPSDCENEWPVPHDLWMSLVDPATGELLLHSVCGHNRSAHRRHHYGRPGKAGSTLYDSGLCMRPWDPMPHWDGRSLIIRCGLVPFTDRD